MKKPTQPGHSGFTLIELLVVIAIIGILAGIVGPKIFDVLTRAEAKKTQSIFKAWATAVANYKSEYKHLPPVLLQQEEGVPLIIGKDYPDDHAKFIAALAGREWDVNTRRWNDLAKHRDQNRKNRLNFHTFQDDEFGEDGYLSDAWGGSKFRILSDRNNDGLIELQDAALSEILDALKETYDSDVVDAAKNKIRSIHADVAFYVLIEDEVPENVFSWDVEKYMK